MPTHCLTHNFIDKILCHMSNIKIYSIEKNASSWFTFAPSPMFMYYGACSVRNL